MSALHYQERLDKIDELINKRVIEIVEPYISKFTLFIDEYEK